MMRVRRFIQRIGEGQIARATFRTSVVLAMRFIAQAFTLLIVARLLGPASFGAFAGMAALAVLLGTLTNFGTHLLLLREVAGEPANAPLWLPRALAAALLCGSILFGIYLLLTMLWLRPVGMSMIALAAIAISDIVAMPLLQLPSVMRQGAGQIARSQLLVVLPQGMRFLAAALVALWQPVNPLTVYALAYAAAALLCLPIGARAMPRHLVSWKTWRWQMPNKAQWREASGFAALSLSALGPNELDKTLAVRLLPAMAAGTYAAGSRVLGPLILPVLAMMLAALPRLFREQTVGGRMSNLTPTVLLASLGYGVCAGLALWFVAPLVTWFFGARYADLTVTLRWLTLAIPGMALRYSIGSVLMSRSQPWLRWQFEIMGMLVLVFAAITLTKIGIAQPLPIALASAEAAMAIVGMNSLHRLTHPTKQIAP